MKVKPQRNSILTQKYEKNNNNIQRIKPNS